MEGRTRLALGGMATVAASVAVVCAVAMSTTVALADSAGSPAGARSVIVPASAATPVAASATPSPTPQPQVPAVEAETVPAPEPEDVASVIAPQTPTGEQASATEDEIVAEVEESGSWDDAYAWAQKRGWSAARIEAWIARLESKIAGKGTADTGSDQLSSNDSGAGNRTDPLLPADAGTPSGRDHSGSTSGLKREQSRVPPG